MMLSERVTTSQVRAAIVKATSDLEAKAACLSQLDAAIGDGDMGHSIANGCRAIREELSQKHPDVMALLSEAGLIFSESAGATIGALVGIALLRAGATAKGKVDIGVSDLAEMLRAAEDGIRARGKAAAGDKTLLDAIIPARQALESCAVKNCSLAKAGRDILEASRAGMIATTEMTAKFGRGRWLGERSKGHQDAGATAVYLLFSSLAGDIEG